jgi:chromosome partitioning protein
VVFNQKGGVGKTSVACNLAAAFAKLGRCVLVVDLDSQSNASQYLLSDRYDRITYSISDYFESLLSFKLFQDNLNEAVYTSPWLDIKVIPATLELHELQAKLEAKYKVFKLARSLDGLLVSRSFDHVIFDTPPALNFYTMSAMIAGEKVLVPFDCDAFSAEAVSQVARYVAELAEDHNPGLSLHGVIINQFQANARFPGQLVDELLGKGLPVLNPYLDSSVAMKESRTRCCPLPLMKPSHKLTRQFMELASSLDAYSSGKATSETGDLSPTRKSPTKTL